MGHSSRTELRQRPITQLTQPRGAGSTLSDKTLWKIAITKEKFDTLKKKEEVWGLVALSRAANELRFVQMPLVHHEKTTRQLPCGQGTTLSFVQLRTLRGRLPAGANLNRHFGHMPEFQGTGYLFPLDLPPSLVHCHCC